MNEHGNDGGGEGRWGRVRRVFAHQGVDHEIWRVGLDNVGGGRSANDVGLMVCKDSLMIRGVEVEYEIGA